MITFELTWMPSHLRTRPDKKRPEYVTDFDIEGNEVADQLAETAATKFRLPDLVALPYLTKLKLVMSIQRRLIAI